MFAADNIFEFLHSGGGSSNSSSLGDSIGATTPDMRMLVAVPLDDVTRRRVFSWPRRREALPPRSGTLRRRPCVLRRVFLIELVLCYVCVSSVKCERSQRAVRLRRRRASSAVSSLGARRRRFFF